MTQTLAILLDAYRELNARKMFWISLIVSGVVIAAFALLGVNDKELTLFTMELPMPAARFWYKWAFSFFVIGIWISWGAVGLALISTASIFPDLIAGGSIDLYLSKPISRLRLFLTKYLGGLLFVVLQTAVFALGCYLVFGWRSGQWRTSIFLIVPLTTLLFSYLFAVCVLVGVLTRSTIAALLVTILAWFLFSVSTYAEQITFMLRTSANAETRVYERQAAQADAEIAKLKSDSSLTNLWGLRERGAERRRDAALRNAESSRSTAGTFTTIHRILRAVTTVLPKTNETIAIIDRRIFDDADLAAYRKQTSGQVEAFEAAHAAEASAAPRTPPSTNPATAPTTGPADDQAAVARAEMASDWRQRDEAQREAEEITERAARGRSVSRVLFSSLAFEFVVLGWAAWVFCRRDY